MSIVQHGDKNSNAVTPAEVADLARLVMGTIDLDPASDPLANRSVRATRFIAPPEDGLSLPWAAKTVWLNPPGGTLKWDDAAQHWRRAGAGEKGRSSATLWWARFSRSYEAEEFREGIFLGFTLELLSRAQSANAKHPLDTTFALCVPRDRIRFRDPDTLAEMSDPAHANVLIYAGPHKDRFGSAFSSLGACRL